MSDEEFQELVSNTIESAKAVIEGKDEAIKMLRSENHDLRNHIEGLVHLAQTGISELTDKQAKLLSSMSNAIETTAAGMVKLSFNYDDGQFFRLSASEKAIARDPQVRKTYEFGLLLLERQVDRGRVVTPEPATTEEPKPEGWQA